MRRGWTACAVALAGLCAAAAGRAQDAKSASGATVPAGMRAYVVVDDRFAPKVSPPKKPEDRDPRDRTNKIHDLIVEHGLNPTLAVLTRTPPTEDSPAARLAKQLDPLVAKYRGNNFGAFVVFLTLEKEFPQDNRRDAAGNFLRDLQVDAIRKLAAQLKTPHVVFGLAAGQSPQVEAWQVGENDLVVVLYDKMRVLKRWNFAAGQAPTDAQLKQIVDETAKVAARGK
jgi:hypothetical protein